MNETEFVMLPTRNLVWVRKTLPVPRVDRKLTLLRHRMVEELVHRELSVLQRPREVVQEVANTALEGTRVTLHEEE